MNLQRKGRVIEMEPEEEIQMIFDFAKVKFFSKNSKPGNTERPWDDFSIDHLDERMNDEIDEYHDSGKMKELLDIINMAAILYLAHIKRVSEGVD